MLDFIFDILVYLINIISSYKRVSVIILALIIAIIGGSISNVKLLNYYKDKKTHFLALSTKDEPTKRTPKVSVKIDRSEIDEVLHASAQEEVIVLKYIFEEIVANAIDASNINICGSRLRGQYKKNCNDQYWNFVAIRDSRINYCNNIRDALIHDNCLNTVATSSNSFMIADSQMYESLDDEIQMKSASCQLLSEEDNRSLCWNSLYLELGIKYSDLYQCENILEDDVTQDICITQVTDKINNNIMSQAADSENLSYCNSISNESSNKKCIRNTLSKILVFSINCNQECIDDKSFELAIAFANPNMCYKVSSHKRESCEATAVQQEAMNSLSTDVCNDLNAVFRVICVNKVESSVDEKAAEVVQKEEDSYFDSVLQELMEMESDTVIDDSGVNVSLCASISSSTKKLECEDILIYDYAIENYDIEKCQYVSDSTMQNQCETSIIGAEDFQYILNDL